MIKSENLLKSLRSLGLEYGDSVFLHSALKGLGPIQDVGFDDKQGYCKAIYECLDQVLGIETKEGTLVVPTMTHDYVRKKIPFILEETPSEVGILTEYIRKLPGTLRTLHPINSVAVRGALREAFSVVSTSGYGMGSSFDVFSKIEESKVLYIGATINHTTFVHHIEQMVGVSYVYNKTYFEPSVFANGTLVNHPFSNSVRYLNKGIKPDYTLLKRNLHKSGKMEIQEINGFTLMLVSVIDLLNEIYSLLQLDQCSLLSKPVYITT